VLDNRFERHLLASGGLPSRTWRNNVCDRRQPQYDELHQRELQLTARGDCARSVSGTLKDTTTETSTSSEVDTFTNTLSMNFKDSIFGYLPAGPSTVTASSTETIVSSAGSCIWKGSGTPGGGLYAFFGPATTSHPYYSDGGLVTLTGGCSYGGPTTSMSIGFQYCQTPAQATYGSTSESTLVFKCSTVLTAGEWTYKYVGSGTLTATHLDSCGLWTTGCNISASGDIRMGARNDKPKRRLDEERVGQQR
jgi:hypothetical protein